MIRRRLRGRIGAGLVGLVGAAAVAGGRPHGAALLSDRGRGGRDDGVLRAAAARLPDVAPDMQLVGAGDEPDGRFRLLSESVLVAD